MPFQVLRRNLELTLEERPLGREVEALVEQLRPLLAQVVTQGADAAVEDAMLVLVAAVVRARAATYRPSIEM